MCGRYYKSLRQTAGCRALSGALHSRFGNHRTKRLLRRGNRSYRVNEAPKLRQPLDSQNKNVILLPECLGGRCEGRGGDLLLEHLSNALESKQVFVLILRLRNPIGH